MVNYFVERDNTTDLFSSENNFSIKIKEIDAN